LHEIGFVEAAWLLFFFKKNKNFLIPAILNSLFLISAKNFTIQSLMIAVPSVYRVIQRGTRAFLLYERLDSIFQFNETGIALQVFFETGRKFVRKAPLAEFF